MDRVLIFSTSAWITLGLWIFLLPAEGGQVDASKETDYSIKRANKAVQLFKQQYKGFPNSMTELKAFDRLHNLELSLYDGYGHPLEYIPLSKNNYVLRSFGKDGGQNTLLLSKDQSGTNVKVLPSETAMMEYWMKGQLSTFPPVLLTGSNSPNMEWHAKLYANFEDGKRRLVVHHRRKKAFFMVSRHDAIEEFLWLPSGYALVYTATSSNTYRDGIYYWDLLEDETVNLLAAGSMSDSVAIPVGAAARYMISLAGIDIEGAHAFVYLVHESYGNILDPIELFSSDALVKVSLPVDRKSKILFTRALPQEGLSLFEAEPPRYVIEPSNSLSMKIQRSWIKMDLSGDVPKRIAQWKAFIKKYHESELYPYALYYLMQIYHTAMSTEEESDDRRDYYRKQTLQTARELVEYPMSPSYLKGIGRFVYFEAENGQAIKYEIDPLKYSF